MLHDGGVARLEFTRVRMRAPQRAPKQSAMHRSRIQVKDWSERGAECFVVKKSHVPTYRYLKRLDLATELLVGCYIHSTSYSWFESRNIVRRRLLDTNSEEKPKHERQPRCYWRSFFSAKHGRSLQFTVSRRSQLLLVGCGEEHKKHSRVHIGFNWRHVRLAAKQSKARAGVFIRNEQSSCLQKYSHLRWNI